MVVIEQFVALAGLPRTGSTLLSAILSQNPEIHAEGNSAVCQLMWETQQAVIENEQIRANNKLISILDPLVTQVLPIYYSDVTKPIIVDKCRTWTLPSNMDMLYRYFDDSPKVIVLVRPMVEIVASFMSLRQNSGWEDLEARLFDDGSEPIMRPLAGVEWARKNNNGEFLFVTYDELVDDTKETLSRIYEHCRWKPFKHNLNKIVKNFSQSDEVYGLVGMHDIRSQISRRTVDVDLSLELIEKCNKLDEWSMYGSLC